MLLSLERVLSLAVVERWDVEKLQSFLAEVRHGDAGTTLPRRPTAPCLPADGHQRSSCWGTCGPVAPRAEPGSFRVHKSAGSAYCTLTHPSQRTQATAVLSLRSKWEDTILDMSWRIDVLTSTKAGSAEDLSEPVAMVELSVGPVRGSPSVTTCLRRTPHPRLPSQRPESALTQHGHAAQTSAASSRAAPSSKKAHSASAVSHSSRDASSDAPSSSALRFEATREQLQALLGQMAAAEAAIQNLGGGATA